ncbi:ComF family protein [Desertibacillus haloalkaliphilus]|uniref:ComF family protein n=1 Tax=Desertibacillus haloalkaliphilus TaxID=1328930 RepID=UPI001C27D5BA|nr:ComF family protein [Desertibacillus haloalkaliphilus]MBU8905983.1 ComF family protein [Desertibacillus haloalkaliphilus]
MQRCLWCSERFYQQAKWRFIFGREKEVKICNRCESGLSPIKKGAPICRGCGRSLAELEPRFCQGEHCTDCLRWEESDVWRGVLVKNRSLYSYDSFLKEWMARFKFRGDVILADALGDQFRALYEKECPNHLIVPIPLSDERLYERGFNQAEVLARLIAEPLPALMRTEHEQKQSKKNRSERLALMHQPFAINEELRGEISGQKVVLIDDIYTTGATVRQAAVVLKRNGAASVSSLTLARG